MKRINILLSGLIFLFFMATGFSQNITVTNPNGGESWQKGSTYNITWSSSGVSGNIIIKLLKSGNMLGSVAWNIPNTGNYSWTINDIAGTPIQPGNNYTVLVRSFNDHSIQDESNTTFTILSNAGIIPGKSLQKGRTVDKRSKSFGKDSKQDISKSKLSLIQAKQAQLSKMRFQLKKSLSMKYHKLKHYRIKAQNSFHQVTPRLTANMRQQLKEIQSLVVKASQDKNYNEQLRKRWSSLLINIGNGNKKIPADKLIESAMVAHYNEGIQATLKKIFKKEDSSGIDWFDFDSISTGSSKEEGLKIDTVPLPEDTVMEHIKNIEEEMEKVRNKRQEFTTMFENFDQKANQLFNILSTVLKNVKDMNSSVSRTLI